MNPTLSRDSFEGQKKKDSSLHSPLGNQKEDRNILFIEL